MGNILILYDSATGHTAKMAALVAEGAESIAGMDVRVRDVQAADAEDVCWCDGLAVGSPTNMGILSWKMKRFWDEVMAPHWMKGAHRHPGCLRPGEARTYVAFRTS